MYTIKTVQSIQQKIKLIFETMIFRAQLTKANPLLKNPKIFITNPKKILKIWFYKQINFDLRIYGFIALYCKIKFKKVFPFFFS